MSTIEMPQPIINPVEPTDKAVDGKLIDGKPMAPHHQQPQQPQQALTAQEKSQQHPLHQFDLTGMAKFYESCVGKLKEQTPKWQPTEWVHINPMPSHLSWEQKYDWPNPLVLSQKQRVTEAFARLARESGEPMILMPNFDYGDILNFERFLQALKQDGINAIGKYKQYLNNKDMRKFEVDLVVVHPRYGVLLFEIKDCDHLDNKRRSRARIQLSNARSCFESMGRLIIEAKGWSSSEASVPITEFIALPNVLERPVSTSGSSSSSSSQLLQTPGGNANHSASSTTSSATSPATAGGRSSRALHFLVKSDLESSAEFAKWWTKHVVEPKILQHQQAEAESRVNKFDSSVMNWMLGLITCIRNNSVMPVVYSESGDQAPMFSDAPVVPAADAAVPVSAEPKLVPCVEQQQQQEPKPAEAPAAKPEQPELSKEEKEQEERERVIKEIQQFQPALNVHAEFFTPVHESVRSLAKVLVRSADAEKIRKTICLQTLWLLLNDSQKKISVICSEMNKAYYEEFFARQRKLYNSLNNVRFYCDLDSCAQQTGPNTLKKSAEIWFFDSALNGTLAKVAERAKDLHAYWIFTTETAETLEQLKPELSALGARDISLDENATAAPLDLTMPWFKGTSIKLPMRLQCDLLIVGDLISLTQLKGLYRYLKSTVVNNNAAYYLPHGASGPHDESHADGSQYGGHQQPHGPQQQQQPHGPQQQQKLKFNPSKKFRSVKFIRGGTIENLRTSLKMHDSIQASVVLMHVGDEDLFKTRNSITTAERIKHLATLVKEFCPASFLVMSTLMRRITRTENAVTSDVNRGIVSFCKETRDTLNCHYMLNNQFKPEFHTIEGRQLSTKGLKLYVENMLFVVDHFMVRNNKQQ